ncbi:MAG: tetratricopeptide repeat protein [Planctomycetes bacterium]|nr:tetratricopeptide repeat protein [Planctomycetota bacterium]
MRTWILRAAREWPLWIAVAGILSLGLLPRAAGLGLASADVERREIDDLRRDVDGGDPRGAETRLATFLARNPASPLAAEAELLLAQATIARARIGDFPGAPALIRAGSGRTPALRRESATLLSEYGFHADAVARLRELYDETHDVDLALDLVPALTRLASADAGLRHALLDEAAARLSDFMRIAPPERRLEGILAQSRIFREEGRDEDLLAVLAGAIAEARSPRDRGLLHLERGRTFARLGKHREMEAMSSFDEAEKLLVDPMARGLAAVHMAELFARAQNPECLDVCTRVIASDSPAAPLAQLVAGVFQLKTEPAAAIDSLITGFSRLRRPRLVDPAVFDLDWVTGAVLAAADRGIELDRLASVMGEIGRLQPASMRTRLDQALILLRARRFEEAANLFLAAGEVLKAAEACAEGGLHLRAASLYRRFVELQPVANVDGLFHRALSLGKAGDVAGATAGFADYLSKAGPSGRRAGDALLETARLQEPEQALATYDRVLKAREVATSPERDDWARALLGRGRALVQLSRTAEAQKVLREYLRRYHERPTSIEARWLLAGVAIREGKWDLAITWIDELEKAAESDPAPHRDLLKEARFVRAGLRFTLGDYAAALRGFEEAAGADPAFEDRLRSQIGRARCLSRLDRKEDARKALAEARTMIDQGGFAGPQRDYWELLLNEP